MHVACLGAKFQDIFNICLCFVTMKFRVFDENPHFKISDFHEDHIYHDIYMYVCTYIYVDVGMFWNSKN